MTSIRFYNIKFEVLIYVEHCYRTVQEPPRAAAYMRVASLLFLPYLSCTKSNQHLYSEEGKLIHRNVDHSSTTSYDSILLNCYIYMYICLSNYFSFSIYLTGLGFPCHHQLANIYVYLPHIWYSKVILQQSITVGLYGAVGGVGGGLILHVIPSHLQTPFTVNALRSRIRANRCGCVGGNLQS